MNVDVARVIGEVITPHAARFDAEGRIDEAAIRALAEAGLFGWSIAAEHGGHGADALALGRLHEMLGRACGSTRAILIVHAMASLALARFGTPAQRALLPALARGDRLGAFALSEPGAGGDTSSIEAREERGALHGVKRWITAGQRADLFVVIAESARGPSAYLVERGAPGLSIDPIAPGLGLRAAMLAELRLDGCPCEPLGRAGSGLTFVAQTALDLGRYLVAWGCVGAMAASTQASLAYAAERRAGGAPIGEHQLVQRRLARMIARTRSSRALCESAAAMRDAGDPQAPIETMLAKYVASTSASEVTHDAVQVHGARGVAAGSLVERHFRDAKVAEIIEGTTELSEITLARAWLAREGHDV